VLGARRVSSDRERTLQRVNLTDYISHKSFHTGERRIGRATHSAASLVPSDRDQVLFKLLIPRYGEDPSDGFPRQRDLQIDHWGSGDEDYN
jgi:hypothetical protein